MWKASATEKPSIAIEIRHVWMICKPMTGTGALDLATSEFGVLLEPGLRIGESVQAIRDRSLTAARPISRHEHASLVMGNGCTLAVRLRTLKPPEGDGLDTSSRSVQLLFQSMNTESTKSPGERKTRHSVVRDVGNTISCYYRYRTQRRNTWDGINMRKRNEV